MDRAPLCGLLLLRSRKLCEALVKTVAVATELTQVLQELLMAVEITYAGTMTSYSGNVLERRQRAAAEFLAWAEHHAHDVLRQQAAHVQVEGHDDRLDQRSAMAQQQVCARRRLHAKQLHDSSMALLRHG
ncbi:hypothetical protein MITS9509_01128 [Synechococcus sp. MIT S9509]|nr:hypothetical protein MITS9504_00694 [Synechococcus sp. MIT S9504]KZR92679.1 hypothetical protein MITS9509_01128 [Synechococcus sp. MIT S9509]